MSDDNTQTTNPEPAAEGAAPAPEASDGSDYSGTQATAAAVLDDLEADAGPGDSGTGDEPSPSAEAAPEPAKEPEKAPEPELSEAAKWLLKEGHKLKNDQGKDAWTRMRAVEKMLDRYAGEHRAKWDGERTTLTSQLQEAKGHLDEMYQDIMGEPRALVEKLAGVNPKFRTLLEPQAPAAGTATDPIDKEPEPDYPLPDGSYTYSREGIKRLREYDKQQILKQLDERIRPLTERDKATERERQLHANLGEQMQTAQSWPMFGQLPPPGQPLTPFQQEVLGELRQESEQARAARRRPTMTLRQAYLEVYARHQEPDKVRERVLAEVKHARPSPATTGAAERTTTTRPGSIRDVAANVYDSLSRGQ